MFDKRWHWFDFFLIALRTVWFGFRLRDMQAHPGGLHAESTYAMLGTMWLDVFLLTAAYVLPLLAFCMKKLSPRVMILVEVLFSGTVFFYIVSDVNLEIGLAFYCVPIFTIGYLSSGWIMTWSLPAILLPLAAKSLWEQSLPEALGGMLFDFVLFFFLGYCFGKMKDSFLKVNVMNDIIRQQNQTLEHYAAQIERLTLVEERSRLSRDLHDTVGHTLTTTIMGMNAARLLIDTSPEEAKHNLRELVQATKGGLEEVRRHIHQIAPAKEERPLSVILSEMTHDFAVYTDIQGHLEVEGQEIPVSEQVRLTLTRCLQESLTNASKHGQASAVRVRLVFSEHSLIMQVTDNGKGTDGIVSGFGLQSMKERLENLNGTLQIDSSTPEGTTILCTVPILLT